MKETPCKIAGRSAVVRQLIGNLNIVVGESCLNCGVLDHQHHLKGLGYYEGEDEQGKVVGKFHKKPCPKFVSPMMEELAALDFMGRSLVATYEYFLDHPGEIQESPQFEVISGRLISVTLKAGIYVGEDSLEEFVDNYTPRVPSTHLRKLLDSLKRRKGSQAP